MNEKNKHHLNEEEPMLFRRVTYELNFDGPLILNGPPPPEIFLTVRSPLPLPDKAGGGAPPKTFIVETLEEQNSTKPPTPL